MVGVSLKTRSPSDGAPVTLALITYVRAAGAGFAERQEESITAKSSQCSFN